MAIVAIMASGLVGDEGKQEGFLGICQIHHRLRSRVAERLEARAFHFQRQHTFIDKARIAFGAAHGDPRGEDCGGFATESNRGLNKYRSDLVWYLGLL